MKWSQDKVKGCVMSEAPHLWERTALKNKQKKKRKKGPYFGLTKRKCDKKEISVVYKNTMDQLGTNRHQFVEAFLPFRTVDRLKLWSVCLSSPVPPAQYILEDADCVLCSATEDQGQWRKKHSYLRFQDKNECYENKV